MSDALLSATGVTKRYAGIVALQGVSLQVHAGEFAAVIGPNGAGKSTLFDCLTGVQRPDRGHVTFDGRPVDSLKPAARARAGMARTFQRLELFGGMTVLDHLIVADRARTRRGGLLADVLTGSHPSSEELDRCATVLELLGLEEWAERPAESLSLGKGRLVELARALVCEPKLLFLDEPSSGLDRHETDEMGHALQRVQREHGIAILLIEHDVPLVQRLAERISVLDYGELIASGPTEEVLSNQKVRVAYLGGST